MACRELSANYISADFDEAFGRFVPVPQQRSGEFATDANDVVRDTLCQMYLGTFPLGGREIMLPGTRLLHSLTLVTDGLSQSITA